MEPTDDPREKSPSGISRAADNGGGYSGTKDAIVAGMLLVPSFGCANGPKHTVCQTSESPTRKSLTSCRVEFFLGSDRCFVTVSSVVSG